jgi:hypothetical protein
MSPIVTRQKEPGFFMATLPLNADNAHNRFPTYSTAQNNETGAIQGNFFPKILLAQTVTKASLLRWLDEWYDTG